MIAKRKEQLDRMEVVAKLMNDKDIDPEVADAARDDWNEQVKEFPGFDDDYAEVPALRDQVDAEHRKGVRGRDRRAHGAARSLGPSEHASLRSTHRALRIQKLAAHSARSRDSSSSAVAIAVSLGQCSANHARRGRQCVITAT
jgi:CCR4-NOT transcriptional regulation complex NOT5 subunit